MFCHLSLDSIKVLEEAHMTELVDLIMADKLYVHLFLHIFDALDGCAKAIVAKCKDAGVVMTGAGATYPYGKDPHDSNIRIAPSFPTLEDLKLAAEIFCVCVKLVSIDKLLAE